MPHLTSHSPKGTAFSRKTKTEASKGTARLPQKYGIKGADQTPSFHIRPADDSYEQQADRIAEKITHQLQTGTPVKRSSEAVKPLKVGVSNQKGESVSEKTAAEIAESQGKGQPLPSAIRQPAEKALGKSLADVRLHTGAKVSSLSREVGAEAFAVKKNIFVGNQLDLSQPEGQEVALHEAVHTLQQKNGGAESGAIQRGKRKDKKNKKSYERVEAYKDGTAGATAADLARAKDHLNKNNRWGPLPPLTPAPPPPPPSPTDRTMPNPLFDHNRRK